MLDMAKLSKANWANQDAKMASYEEKMAAAKERFEAKQEADEAATAAKGEAAAKAIAEERKNLMDAHEAYMNNSWKEAAAAKAKEDAEVKAYHRNLREEMKDFTASEDAARATAKDKRKVAHDEVHSGCSIEGYSADECYAMNLPDHHFPGQV